MDIKRIIGDYSQFLEDLLANQAKAGINTDKYEIDHLGYRVASQEEYLSVRDKLKPLSSEVATTIHNGREFSIFKLIRPLVFANKRIPLIELPTPSADNTFATGLEHAEFVVPKEFDKFCELHKDLFTQQPDTGSANATASITFSNRTTVKYHPISLEAAVAIQGDKFILTNG